MQERRVARGAMTRSGMVNSPARSREAVSRMAGEEWVV